MFALTPSTRTVVDCTIHSPHPVVTLVQPGHCHQADWLPSDVLPQQGQQEVQGEDVALMNLDARCCQCIQG